MRGASIDFCDIAHVKVCSYRFNIGRLIGGNFAWDAHLEQCALVCLSAIDIPFLRKVVLYLYWTRCGTFYIFTNITICKHFKNKLKNYVSMSCRQVYCNQVVTFTRRSELSCQEYFCCYIDLVLIHSTTTVQQVCLFRRISLLKGFLLSD